MRLASIKQTIEYMNGAITRKAIYSWISRKVLRATRIQSHILIDLDHLDHLLEENTTGPQPVPPEKLLEENKTGPQPVPPREPESPPIQEPRAKKKKRKPKDENGQIDLW